MIAVNVDLWRGGSAWVVQVQSRDACHAWRLPEDREGHEDAQAFVERLLHAAGLLWHADARPGRDAPMGSAVALVRESFADDRPLMGLHTARVDEQLRMIRAEYHGRPASRGCIRIAAETTRGTSATPSDAVLRPSPSRNLTTTARPARRVSAPAGPSLSECSAMGFEVFTPQFSGRSIEPGTVTVNKSGNLTLTATDLDKAKLNGHAVILLDAEDKRMALRPLGEDEKLPTVKLRRSKSGASATAGVLKALGRLGVDLETQSGHREVKVEDGLLVIDFSK